MPPPAKNLDELARSLLTKGPTRTLAAAGRRIRLQLGGHWIADTTLAVFVWEHPYYPFYYIPKSAFASGTLSTQQQQSANASSSQGYKLATLGAGGKSTDRVIVFDDNATQEGKEGPSPLAGLVRVEFGAVDAWFEEDARIDIHPRDPYKRVDVVYSSRPVRVLVNGHVVANAPGGSFHLWETGLPTRYYLPAAAVDARYLRDSHTVTGCPYKGEANYYNISIPGDEKGGDEKTFKDVVWYYKTPKLECAAVAGCLCFYNEKVDIELDGKLLEKPKSPFS
ncbi:DUF427-domain-containing protein [Xylariaceae sp. FL0255]|nr:DUF427-domain-containing protein [Xylariaceae sp. FL0255]